MIKISKQNNSLIVEGIENVFYINNGDNSYPLNSLIVVTDNSDMATFRSVATNDVLFSGLIKDITINGEAVTKDNIIQKFDAVSNSVDTYTKEESDNKFATKTELTNVQTVANDADTKVDALTPRVEGVETTLGNKQDTLVSGTNIKTINNQSILGEGNIEISGGVSEEQAQEIAKIPTLETDMMGKQDTLVSGTNIKTINSESILGTGDIQINAGARIVKMNDVPLSYFYNLLSDAVSALNNGTDYTKKDSNSNEIIGKEYLDFFNTLKPGDFLSYYGRINGDVFKVECNPLYFEPNTSGNGSYSFDILIKYLGNFNSKNFINYTRDIYVKFDFYRSSNGEKITQADVTVYTKKAGPTLQKNDFKTINGESVIGEGNIEISGGNVDLTNYYTKTESDAKYASKDELAVVETVANDANIKADVATSRVEGVETSLGNKQDTLVSGTNIKTINSQSILGSGDLAISGVSEEQAQEIAKIPTIETELAQKANVSDVPTVQTDDRGTNKNYIYSDVNTSSTKVISDVTLVRQFDQIRMQKYYWKPDDSTSVNYVTDILPSATTTEAGVMSAADKTKLDSIPETIPSQSEIDGIAANVSALETAMADKQPTLVSGTNIKTINSQSILGEGNLEVTIPDATTATSGAMSAADKTKLDSISNEWTGTQAEYDALTTKDNNIIYYVTE